MRELARYTRSPGIRRELVDLVRHEDPRLPGDVGTARSIGGARAQREDPKLVGAFLKSFYSIKKGGIPASFRLKTARSTISR